MKRRNDITMKEAIEEMLQSYQLKEKMNEKKLIEKWELLFGKTINKYTSNIYVKHKKLFLKIDSAPLRQELTFNKEKILSRINLEIENEFVNDLVLL